MAITLQAGDIAPDFTGINQDGTTVQLSKLRGNKVVLFFYPEDDTAACTAQACNLRDHYKELTDAGLTLVGVSPDDINSHKNFIKKYNLPFPLVVDTDKTILNLYGAYGEKNMYGNIVIGVIRSTFLIDEQGKLLKVWRKVNTKTHSEQILKAL